MTFKENKYQIIRGAVSFELANFCFNYFVLKRDGIKFTETISRVNIDNAEFATNGSKLMWSSTFSGGVLGGNENYHKHVFVEHIHKQINL